MKTNEFKELINDVTVALNACMSKAAMDAVGKQVDGMYADGKLTGRQFDTISGVFNDLYESKLTTWKENRKVASEMSKEAVETVEETKPVVVTGEVEAVVDPKTEKTVYAAIDRVNKKLAVISNGYLAIVGDVARLYDMKAWEVTKHKNIYEMCEAKFDGMARGTVNNLLSIFKRFGDKETYKLTDEALTEDGAPRSVRSLLEQIKSEKDALKAEKNGGAIGENADGEAEGESADTKKKPEVVLNVAFDIYGDGEWNAESLAEELKKAIEKAEIDFTKDLAVALTLTR